MKHIIKIGHDLSGRAMYLQTLVITPRMEDAVVADGDEELKAMQTHLDASGISYKVVPIVTKVVEFELPLMTTAGRDSITKPLEGLEITNTDTGKNEYFDGKAWVPHQEIPEFTDLDDLDAEY